MMIVVMRAGASMIAGASPVAKTPWYSAGRSGLMRGTDRPQEAATNQSSPMTWNSPAQSKNAVAGRAAGPAARAIRP